MVGIDTNVLVRHLVQDDIDQARFAGELLEEKCSADDPGHIALIVLCELAWVLRGAYKYQRSEIGRALRQVLLTDCFDVEEHALAWKALDDYAATGADYADCIIARLNLLRGSRTTWTFDRKAAELEGFSLLGA